MPQILTRVNLVEACDLLRLRYFQNHLGIKGACSSDVLISQFLSMIQRARFEDFVITLSSAYAKYQFDLPTFMDFRGRIYRSGVLHFHERDISKSLIVFAGNPSALNHEHINTFHRDLACAAALKYQKFSNLDDALQWYKDHESEMSASDESLIQFAKQASDPFQFLAKVLSLKCETNYHQLPVTQDASASAYQIMSYLLLNVEIGRRTNLLPSEDGQIEDVYQRLKDELLTFLVKRMNPSKYTIVQSILTRKVVKGMFMPVLYGKTVFSMGQDIKRSPNGTLLSNKDCYGLASLSYSFWCMKYPEIVNLMKLLNLIGWVCSKLNKPVLYSTSYITTVQDYMCSEAADILLYDRITKKRRKVTLRVPTNIRDTRKTMISTCVNFIHQKDAYIAMKMIDQFLQIGAPVYTVHEKFITTALYTRMVPKMYTGVFLHMDPPLRIINDFLHQNLSLPLAEDQADVSLSKESDLHRLEEPIPADELRYILESLMPQAWGKTKRRQWEGKIDAIVSSYNQYCRAVCDGLHQTPEDAGKRHAEKWNEFQAELERWNEHVNIYSVHF
jgi:hypothetical protein